MKLGHINYLNMLPLYHRLLAGEIPKGVQLISDLPSGLNRAMKAGELDMSPVSAASYAQMQDHVWLLPEFCLAADGAVRSVLLVSHYPMEQLSGHRVGLSGASHTSVVLLRILLEQCSGLSPQYVASPPAPNLTDLDAALVIGDDALRLRHQTGRFVYDLGTLWKQATGLPMVYAVFAANRKTVNIYRQTISEVVDAFDAAYDWAETHRRGLSRLAVDLHPHMGCDFDEYFGGLLYRFTLELQGALLEFYDRAASLGLIPVVPALSFLSLPDDCSGSAKMPATSGVTA